MFHQLLPAWRGRRVLLAGGDDAMTAAMHAFLDEIGARPLRILPTCSAEALCRTLQTGRGAVLIVPELNALASLQPSRQLPALNALICEAREAGTPLMMLLARGSDAQALSRLMHYADECSRAAHGGAVSIQIIRHEGMPAREACIGALALGARYLMGDLALTGILALKKPAD
ncbi:MAG: hypothetical protein IKJ11_09540 [Clostridia bacterium]|nr:hypothetical protein [Clostridia bacterium]